jgi:hypothetical protein
MVRQQRPGVDGQGLRLDQLGQAGEEVPAVPVVPEDRAALQTPHHDVLEDAGGIEAGTAGHVGS